MTPCPGQPVLTSVDGTLTWSNSEGLSAEQPMESAEAFYCIQLLSLFRPAAFVGSDPGAFSTLCLRDCCDPTCSDLLGRSLSADQNKASGWIQHNCSSSRAGSRTLDEETCFFKPWNPNPCGELPTLERFKGTETNKGNGRFTLSTHVHSGACAH